MVIDEFQYRQEKTRLSLLPIQADPLLSEDSLDESYLPNPIGRRPDPDEQEENRQKLGASQNWLLLMNPTIHFYHLKDMAWSMSLIPIPASCFGSCVNIYTSGFKY